MAASQTLRFEYGKYLLPQWIIGIKYLAEIVFHNTNRPDDA